jgi:nucleoside 2-deoxyribosyltransferase
MSAKWCLFCESYDVEIYKPLSDEKIGYKCIKCGNVQLTEDAYTDFPSEGFSREDKDIISIVLRNEYEISNHRPPKKYLTIEDLKLIINQYTPLDPLAKMDNALINLARASKYAGEIIHPEPDFSYPYYHCLNTEELESVLLFLHDAGFTSSGYESFLTNQLYITAKGYQRLREIAKPGKDSKQCFVAIWFTPEMNEVYEKAIKPAIEFKEKGESSPRFEAVKIDTVEHINDINDEIIAQIRRSRFMVCDLTGYRGGIYFEAGFAYGLGLDVIYMCREDWCKDQKLTNKNGEEVTILYDENKHEIPIKKEGVHFDLTHRNRIEWSQNNLDDFRKRLQERIRAIIV